MRLCDVLLGLVMNDLRFLDGSSDLGPALPGTYDPMLVALSFVVASLAAYAALGLAGRIGAAEGRASRRLWLAAGAASMGVGVWAMHFIGMLAFTLPLTVTYDVLVTLVSIAPAILASGVVLLVICRTTIATRQLILGGVLMGAGIGTMHYTGMAAMRMNAVMVYDPGLFAASILVAVVLATAALYTSLLARARRPQSQVHWTTLGAALVMGSAVVGMHYTGMASARFFPGSGVVVVDQALDQTVLAIWVGLATLPILGLAIVITVIDVRLKAAAHAERMSRARMMQAIDSMSDAFCLWDADRRLVLWNSRFRDFFAGLALAQGTAFETVIRYAAEQRLIALRDGDIERWVADRMAAMARTHGRDVLPLGDGRWLQISWRRPDGQDTPVLFTDVTDLKRAELEVRAHERRLAQQASEANLLHSAAEMAAATESFDEALQQVVNRICEATGWPVGHVYQPAAENPNELVPTQIWHLADAQACSTFREITERTTFTRGEGLPGRILESGHPAWITNVQIDTNFPRNRLAQNLGVKGAFGFPVTIRGELVAVLEFFSYMPVAPDENILQLTRNVGEQLSRVFERKRAEQDLRRAREAAEAANRAKSQFLSNMSHELRTPLNGVLGYAQILQRDRSLSADQRASLEAIENCGQHLLTLINDVLDLSKIESGRLEVDSKPYDLPRLLQSVHDIVRPRADAKGLRLGLEVSAEVPRGIVIDAPKLRQALINLLGNAVKFTAVGSVTLRVAEPSRGRLELAVVDTGAGIPREQQIEIFDPFKQVEGGKATEGTGLGLAISRRLVEAMGGTLRVESEPGQGSCFTIAIPLIEVSDDALVESATTPLEMGHRVLPPGQQVNVLIADDRDTNRDILVRLLNGVGFHTDEAVDGAQAIQKMRLRRFPLVFMDVRMPVMNGLDATRIIRNDPALKDTIVIAISASVFPDAQRQIVEAGCDDFIGKPLRADEVFAKIQRHLKITLIDEGESAATGRLPTGDAGLPPALATDVAQRVRGAVEVGDVTELNAVGLELSGRPGSGSHYGDEITRLAKAFDFEGLLRLAETLEQAATT